jgi:hypothetical protein
MNITTKKPNKSVFSDIDSKEKILTIIGKDPHFVQYIINNKDEFYTSQEKKEKNKTRTITPSLYGLKHIHENLKQFLSKRVLFPKYIHGSVKRKSTKTYVKVHIQKEEVLKFDIKDFYPSINPKFIKRSLTDLGMVDEAAQLIADLCTYNSSLPQGISVGPIIANLVLLPTSKKIYLYCKKHDLDFSVYMDDLTISGNKKIQPYWGTVYLMIKNALFVVSKEKTKFMNKNQAQTTTKLTINTIPRPENAYLRNLKQDIKQFINTIEEKALLLSKYRKDDKQMYASLRGRIVYVKQFKKKTARKLRALLVTDVRN